MDVRGRGCLFATPLSYGRRVDDRTPASPCIRVDVLYYQNSFTFGI